MRRLLFFAIAILAGPALADASLPVPRATDGSATISGKKEGPFSSLGTICKALLWQLADPDYPTHGDLPPRATCTVRPLAPGLAALELRAPDEFLSPAQLPIDDQLRIAVWRHRWWWLTDERYLPPPNPVDERDQPRVLDFARVEREVKARHRPLR